jgi:hypothetical protein
MIAPVNKANWFPILQKTMAFLDTLPFCREREMVKFYIEELKYRFWHHSLGPLCPCTDLDFIEYRPLIDSSGWVSWDKLDIVLLNEIKSENTARIRRRSQHQTAILTQLSLKSGIPLGLTIFADSLDRFEYQQLNPSYPNRFFTEVEWATFLKQLRSNQAIPAI